ncbi:MAG: cyclic-di-AMP receptor [Chloroflexota bacterium]
MKLVIAIVHSEDAGALVDALTDKDYRVTRLHSTGGFLKQNNATVMLGVEEAQVEDVLGLIRETCHSRSQYINPMPPIMEPGEFYMPYPVEVTFGGATVFVVDVARQERL